MNEQEYNKTLSQRFKPEINDKMRASLVAQVRRVLRDFVLYVPDSKAYILDAGCGSGFGLRALKQLGYRNTEGIDYLATLVRYAERRRFRARQGDVHDMPYEDDTFDAVFSRYTLEHCHTPSKVMREMVRVLKPEGLLYVVVSCEILDSKPTQRGITVFKTFDEFVKIIPTDMNLKFKFIHIQNADAGWKEIIYAGRKKKA